MAAEKKQIETAAPAAKPETFERIATALERLADVFAPAPKVRELGVLPRGVKRCHNDLHDQQPTEKPGYCQECWRIEHPKPITDDTAA